MTFGKAIGSHLLAVMQYGQVCGYWEFLELIRSKSMNNKFINICGIPHKIIELRDNFDSDSVHCGQIDYKHCTISINEDMAEEEKQETLCHEIVHGILVHMGYDELSQDERLVQALANGINQTFEIKEQEHE